MNEIPTLLKPKKGRPKGAKDRPKTLEDFIRLALNNPPLPPPKDEKPKAAPGGRGIWAKLKTPEDRTAYAKAIRSKVTSSGLKRSGRRPGTPNRWTATTYAAAQAKAEIDAKHMVAKMREAGLFEGAEGGAEEATTTVLAMLRLPGSDAHRLKCARTLLEFFRPKPVTKVRQVVRYPAEELLDELEKGR